MADPHATWSDMSQAFHVGDACQHDPLPEMAPPPQNGGATGRVAGLQLGMSRPLYGLDEEGNPRATPAPMEEPPPAAPPPPPRAASAARSPSG